MSGQDLHRLWSKAAIGTATGRVVHPLDLSIDDIDIDDIIMALSHIGRFGGHTRAFWSVGQHSLEVSLLLAEMSAAPEVQLWGLLHDASAAYLADIVSPIKPLVIYARPYGGFLSHFDVEEHVQELIAARFDLSWPIPAAVHEADKALMAAEALTFLPGASKWADETLAALVQPLHPVAPSVVRQRWQMRLGELAFRRRAG